LHAFWTALVFVFLAELGDKTQLMTMGFAVKYKPTVVLTGTLLATALLNLLSVGLGEAIGNFLPIFWVNLLAGIAFVVFGVLELRNEQDDEGDSPKRNRFGPFLTITLSFIMAELGDKTMLATFAIATREHNFLQVWAGSTLGLFSCNALAIIAGHFLKNYLSSKKLKYGIALVYIISGIAAIKQAFWPT
jgi:putative Ca2+/H+ antiporter (TMEM165/GDT1 family)